MINLGAESVPLSNRRGRSGENNLTNIRKLVKPVEMPECGDTDSQSKRQPENP